MAPDPAPLPAWIDLRASRLVGRRQERETLNDCWERAASAHAQVVMIGGEAGVGKSRLVAELATAAHDSGARVFAGLCERDHPRPLQPIVDALAPLEAHIADLDLGEDEELGRGLLSGSGASATDVGRHRLFEALLRMLGSLPTDLPRLLVIEDVHWARDTTLELLAFLARRARTVPLMTVVSFRAPNPGEDSEFQSFLNEIYRPGSATRIDLEGLSFSEIVEFLIEVTGRDKQGVVDAATTLSQLTGGNPFYINELWRQVVAGTDDRLPNSVHDAVGTRLNALDPATLDLLAYASILGRSGDLGTLAGVSGRPVASVRTALEDASRGGIVEVRSSHEYSFVHDLTREAILDRLVPNERAARHQQVAEFLDSTGGDDPALAATLAYHYSNAGHHETAARFYAAAGENSRLHFAYEDAADFYHRAASEHTDKVAADRSKLHAAQNLLLAGRFSASARVFDELTKSVDDDVCVRAAIGLAEATWRPGHFGHEAAARLLSARQRLGKDDKSTIGVELRCYQALALAYAGYYDAAEQVGRGALRDARDLQDIRLEAKALLYSKITSPDVDAEIYAGFQHARHLAITAGDMELLGQAAYVRGSLGYVLGDPDAWTESLGDLMEVVNKTDQPFHRLAMSGSMCARAFARGEYEQALGHADRFLDMAEIFGDDPIEGLDGAQRYMINRELGLESIAPLIKGDPEHEVGNWRLGLLSIYTELGMQDAARNVLEELMAGPAPSEIAHRFQGAQSVFLTAAAVALRHRQHAERLYDGLKARSGTNLIWGHFVMVFGSADRYLGMLASLIGEDASTHFDRALKMDTTMGATHHRAETLARYARFLSDRDPGRARALAEQASELARLMGSNRLLAIARLAPSSAPDGLTRRELEVLQLVATGYSNQDIADELFISLNTATNHVRSILTKTGSSNRTQAARYALDAELIQP